MSEDTTEVATKTVEYKANRGDLADTATRKR
jgi:hypothetical protein